MAEPEANALQLILQALVATDHPRLVALDGRCGAGKTTLAAQLAEQTDCTVLHMDDFFLRPSQRTTDRLAEPGGNVDYERFQEEVLAPLLRREAFSYRPYSCQARSLLSPVSVQPGPLTVIEGAYSCHPRFWDAYDLRIFVDISPEEQLARIRRRDGEQARDFQEKWIPMEERYFTAFSIPARCDLRVRL